uniref:Uncharacterized protein n=1 Tax=Chromera velia CCMP2878 TaxID=1169474 RepID=A0A0G4IDP8_9ALVE|eukprot:Cvel_13371.t1-p1 / transcript=Cvel_13371.t1 / gene=Cvel_13371 / organism=Chromera_velia_CCMP2878 / gene_product=hypothetical protein / transcript_product=hypothetical protein / location=Cvel_scaffold909:43251-43589(+) / protein_length=113 / sequence_SO=supercontig / SO=protein_coding / is_pseudo=false
MSGGETSSGGKTRLFHPNLFDFGKGGEMRAEIIPSQPLRWRERRREGEEEGRREKRRVEDSKRRGEVRRGCPIPAPSMAGVERRGKEASSHSSLSQPFIVRRGKKKRGEILLF